MHIFCRHIDAVYGLHVVSAQLKCQYVLIKQVQKRKRRKYYTILCNGVLHYAHFINANCILMY